MITTKTKTGTEITLTATPEKVTASFVLNGKPIQANCVGYSAAKKALVTRADSIGKDVCLTIPESAWRDAQAEQNISIEVEKNNIEAGRNAIISACPSNMIPCVEVFNSDGTAGYKTIPENFTLIAYPHKCQGFGIYYLSREESSKQIEENKKARS